MGHRPRPTDAARLDGKTRSRKEGPRQQPIIQIPADVATDAEATGSAQPFMVDSLN